MIDINCDVGEGLENDHLIMPWISSCNISCGAHAGSMETIDKVIRLASDYKVKIGAHPSFPDRKNFGRKVMELSNAELQKSIENQLQLFKERIAIQNAQIHHVKPHGALYNLIAVNSEKATIVVNAIQSVFKNIQIFVPYQSEIEKVALENGIDILYEAFADRTYNDNLTLVSRLLPNALITDKEQVLTQVKQMAYYSKVTTIHHSIKDIKAQTFCIHGDTKNAVEILEYLHQHLEINN